METKKSLHADLESKNSLFLEFGLAVSLLGTLAAFEWQSPDYHFDLIEGSTEVVVDDDLPPITIENHDVTMPPPPPPAPSDVIEIVDDDEPVPSEADFISSEADPNSIVVIPEPEPVPIEEPDPIDDVFVSVEEMPEFPGGMNKLLKFLANEIKYPVIPQENGISGRVYVMFVINKNGEVSDAKVARSVDPYLDREALRVVNAMPRWKPGKQRGRAVRVSYTVPINFVLQ